MIRKIELLSDNPIITSTIPITSTIKSSSTQTRKYNIVDDKESLKNVKCISCGSQRLYKKGFSKSGDRRLVCKNCGVSFTVIKDGSPPTATSLKRRKPMKWNNREEIVHALKIHYFGEKSEKLQFAKLKETTWDNIMKAIHGLRKRYNISAQEVGLAEYPTKKGRFKKEMFKEQPQPQSQPPQHKENSFNIPTPHPPLELKKEKENEEETKEKTEEETEEEETKSKWWKK